MVHEPNSLKHRSDAELIQDHRGGNRRALATLIERHMGLVHLIALSRLRDRDAAEDLTQEVFLQAILSLDRLRRPERFRAWLAQITRNTAALWLRRDQRRSRLVPLVPIDESHEVPDPSGRGVRQQMEAQEERDATLQALWTLPPDQREVVMLHFMEGLNQREVAKCLGVNQATVSRHLKRATHALREVLSVSIRGARPSLEMSSAGRARIVSLVAAAAALSASSRASLAAAVDLAPTIALAKAGLLQSIALKIKASLLGIKGAVSLIAVLGIGSVVLMNKGRETEMAAVVAEEPGLLEIAIEEFRMTRGRYPASVPGSDPRSVAQGDPLMTEMPTFLDADYQIMIEPVGGNAFFDPHNPLGSPRSFLAIGDEWILVCPGSDAEFELNPYETFQPGATLASPEIAVHLYDPTNGERSTGDIVDIGPRGSRSGSPL